MLQSEGPYFSMICYLSASLGTMLESTFVVIVFMLGFAALGEQ